MKMTMMKQNSTAAGSPRRRSGAAGRTLADLRGDNRGVAVVEFALLLPMMIMLYMGSVELGHALMIDRRVTALSSAAADLVAQTDIIDNSGLTDVYSASSTFLMPYNTANLKISITSLCHKISDNKVYVDWSNGYQGGATFSENSEYSGTVPPGVTTPGSTVIMATVDFTYNSPIKLFNFIQSFFGTSAGNDNFVYSETFYLRPRKSISVSNTDKTLGYACV